MRSAFTFGGTHDVAKRLPYGMRVKDGRTYKSGDKGLAAIEWGRAEADGASAIEYRTRAFVRSAAGGHIHFAYDPTLLQDMCIDERGFKAEVLRSITTV